MEHMTNRQIKALETKQALLQTGLDLFDKKGFDNVTVEEIAKSCNVSKGAFYVHFKSKYDVFNEKFKDFDKYYLIVQNDMPENISASEKIQIFFEKQMIYLRDVLGKDLIRTVYMNAMSHTIEQDHYLTSPERNLYRIIKSYIAEGIKNNEFKEDITLDTAAKFITRSMRGTIYDWVIFGEDFDVVEEMNNFVKTILVGIQIK